MRHSLALGIRGVSFVAGLALYLRNPHDTGRARAIVEARLANRERAFLDLARRAIYRNRRSPYLALLRHIGCEFGDLDALVRREGLEGSLAALYRRGVYLSQAELQGDQPALRGSLRLDVSFERVRSGLAWVRPELDNGSRLDWRLLYHAMFSGASAHAVASLGARGGLGWSHAVWNGPSHVSVLWLLRYLVAGYTAPLWFSRYERELPDLSADDRRAALLIPVVSRLAGTRLPDPVRVPIERPERIVQWIGQELAVGRTPHLVTGISLALTVVRAAQELGARLDGAQFSVSGEAVTAARREAISTWGGAVFPSYGAKESGMIAHGCLQPRWPDEMHLYSDCHALIQAGSLRAETGLPEDAVLVTSLRQWWPMALLNVSLGDRADLSPGECGCPMEQVGWRTRLHTVRSYEKLKVGYAPISRGAVLELLERELPRRFGGGPLSYQLVELDEQISHGLFPLQLVVEPSVGEIDEIAVIEAISREFEKHIAMLPQYRERVGWITVLRRKPFLTSSGKMLQLCRKSSVADTLVTETLGS